MQEFDRGCTEKCTEIATNNGGSIYRVLSRFSSTVEGFENDLHRKHVITRYRVATSRVFHGRMRCVSFYSRRAEIETFEIP